MMRGTRDIDQDARAWARVHASDAYNYSSVATWYGAAVSAGIISRAEADVMRDYYGATWDYAGD